jgi:DNA-binding MarR family transcriptional regulator
MTKMVDRLERAGYVWRSADPSDRRRVVVTAVPERLAAVTAHFAPMGEKMSRHLAGRTAGELAVILAFMRAGSEAADEEITRIRAGGARHATRRSARADQGQA